MAVTPSSSKARILVVDDHPVVRDGLMRLIGSQADLQCCGQAGSAAEALEAIARLKPDLLVLDLRLKDGDGLELIKALKSRWPRLRILVLSQFESKLYVERALRAGALGYVVKEQAAEEILQAMRTVLAGEVYLTRAMGALLLHRFVGAAATERSALERLTDRQLHVLQLLSTGMSTREIAAELKLSFKTVETHRENIKRKLGLTTASELLHYAACWGQEQISLPPQKLQDKGKRTD
jgi:DNA-binding NarL/FixJ family response regulator